jgi:hypothetical protein
MLTGVKWGWMLIAALLVVFAGSSSAGTKHYVVTNDDSTSGNTITVFLLNPSNGTLKAVKSVSTGGTGLGGGYSAIPLVSIDSSDKCVFATDATTQLNNVATGDVAAFTTPSFTLVGDYSDASLNGTVNGIGLALSPTGQYLYAAYSGSSNIAVWQINTDCSLTLLNTYPTPAPISAMVVRQQGSFQYLMVTYPDGNAIDLFTIGGNGTTLTEQPSGPVTPNHTPSGLDITQDGNVALIGDITNPVQVETYWVSNDATQCSPGAAPCLTGHQNFINLGDANGAATLWLSPQAWSTGSGCLYIANGGTFTVTPANFTEGSAAGKVTLTNGKAVRLPLRKGVLFLGEVQTVTPVGAGGGVYVAEYPSLIGTMKANADCSLVTGKSNLNPTPGASVTSITAWPPR